jgi:O-antigen/teichoic acid export membrane protein
MSLHRIAKTGSAILSAQGISVITQLLLPPIFLRNYGIAAYGEWLTLTAAVVYLSTLNFGLPTFANNQVAICYNRGEFEEANTIQATAILLLLCMLLAIALITALVFVLPINHWLGLKTDRAVVSWTIYLLGLQVLVRMFFGYFAGAFLSIGAAHRGTNWIAGLSLGSVIGTAALALMHVSFVLIAGQQLLTMLCGCGLVMIDFHKKAPDIYPRLRYAKPKRFAEILKPSGYFGVLYISNFLVFQLPIILLQRMLGPASVVVFSLTRTIFSMSRQVLASVSQAIGPEITEMYGKRDWSRLVRLYELSERVVFALVPSVSIGTLLLTPLLMTMWIHRRSLYDPYVCIVMALISGVMGIKEHKYTFQTYCNEHTVLARVMFFSYLLMVILAIPSIYFFGVLGFLVLWLITEVVQVFVILNINEQMFAKVSKLDHSPVYKLFGLIGIATLLGGWFAINAVEQSLALVTLIAIAFVGALLTISFPLFGLKEVRAYLRARTALTHERPA